MRDERQPKTSLRNILQTSLVGITRHANVDPEIIESEMRNRRKHFSPLTTTEFDIANLNYPFSFFYPYVSHCSRRKRLSITDAATLTTAIIDRYLLHKETLLNICGDGMHLN